MVNRDTGTRGREDGGTRGYFAAPPHLRVSLSPWLQVALIVVAAVFFRLWQIGDIPPGLFGDEAVEGLDALDVLAGRGQVFFPANYGREGLYIWLVAGSIKLFGVTPLAVRLPAIVIGILTCIVAWWLAREWGRGDKETRRHGDVGTRGYFSPSPRFPLSASPRPLFSVSPYLPLLTGLYVAIAYWHVHFSRFSQRTILTPLFVGLAAAAFWRGVNLGRTRWFLVAGAGLGLALHSYSVGRFFPVFLVIFLLMQFGIRTLDSFSPNARDRLTLKEADTQPQFQHSGAPTRWVSDPPDAPLMSFGQPAQPVEASSPDARLLVRHWRDILLMFLVAAVIFAPLGVYFLTHPGSFLQRASVVATYAGSSLADTLALISRAALANLAQYVLPGAGDQAQFHNLPGRPIFEPLTALLALLGLLIALRRWHQPRFLFLLLWLAILTAPAALATDRFPTLPRVLGVIPGLYLFPALGLSAVVAWVIRWLARIGEGKTGRAGERESGREGEGETRSGGGRQRGRINFVFPRPCALVSPRLLASLSTSILVAALLLPAAVTYRDYFRVWGPSAATFDAFEGDMAAAWSWLAHNKPEGHIYLSSDIYRHPTFMLLAERATVQTYFQHRNPSLSWFDGRDALPLPPPGQPVAYLIGASAPLAAPAEAVLAAASLRDVVRDPAGAPALTVLTLPPGADPALPVDTAGPAVAFSEQLTLLAAGWEAHDGDNPLLILAWRTTGPAPADWGGYRLEAVASEQVVTSPFEAFRGPEWVAGGRFITWHRLDLLGPVAALRMRLVRMADDQPLVQPDAPDGWHVIAAR